MGSTHSTKQHRMCHHQTLPTNLPRDRLDHTRSHHRSHRVNTHSQTLVTTRFNVYYVSFCQFIPEFLYTPLTLLSYTRTRTHAESTRLTTKDYIELVGVTDIKLTINYE